MITTIAVLSLLSSAAWAQLIPSGISSSCSGFLTSLNSDPTIDACIAPLVSATSAYGPLGAHPKSPTLASMTTALDTFCAAANSTTCPPALMRGKLTDFYAACTKELGTDFNVDVVTMYDTFYTLIPLQEAVCSKDDNGRYCVTETSKGSAGNTKRELAARAPAAGQQTAFVPNVTSIASSNLLFLFITPDLPSATLCTTCTKDVLGAYLGFESTMPYAPGLAQSVLLKGQVPLYQGVTNTCGSTFLGGAVQAAAGLGSNGILGQGTSGAPHNGLQLSGVLAGLAAIGCAFAL